MSNQTQISINFRIKKLELLDHSLSISAIPPNIQNGDSFFFTTTVNLNLDLDSKNLSVKILCKFAYDEVREVELGNISSLTTFSIEDLDKFRTKNETISLIQLPDVLMANFIGLAISSTRGMLATITKGTPLESAILPIQNPLYFAQQLGVKR